MRPTSHAFNRNAHAALADERLQEALNGTPQGMQSRRASAVAQLPEFEALREHGREIKNHVIAHLDLYLLKFEEAVTRQGGHMHWARDAAEARRIVLDICRKAGARHVTKGKSMVTEEIGLTPFLEANGIEAVETDLGEYIIQLRGETPSHIVAPAFHLKKPQIADAFREKHKHLDPERPLTEDRQLLDEARGVLRDKFIKADVGITGANFCVAETGSTLIVTNEGNGDLTQVLPRIHIAVTGMEKLVPTMEDAFTLLRLLARSATGQEFSCYTTVSTGPRRPGDIDGPEEFHVVLLDNGRSALVGSEMQEVLRCIRCGACMNHCPVYGAVGGHAYGWVYPGPIGAALNPGLIGLAEGHALAGASTFCGRCEEVCPMKIPLPGIMRHWREKAWQQQLAPPTQRWGLGLWAWFARRPALYRLASGLGARLLSGLGGRKGRLRWLPMAGGWTSERDFPAPPAGGSFMQQWQAREKRAAPKADGGKV
ncbi:LutB/LldF family L-lactate oxidation iron-sulfur protein [Radicibacter daui]|uniref:LutB/LldF family L-lactate oxidation iron-sulfur protein n=1 Tax=Radicibacter daui TaxID=3064829 RepID=UPI004046A303